jgi:hypothetical protein
MSPAHDRSRRLAAAWPPPERRRRGRREAMPEALSGVWLGGWLRSYQTLRF